MFTSSQPVFATETNAKNTGENIDYLTLAALLIKDGHYERASIALENVTNELSSNTHKSKDTKYMIRYFTIKGLVDLKLENYNDAIRSFLEAKKLRQNNLSLYIYLAQSYYHVEKFEQALAALKSGGDELYQRPKVWLLEAQIHWAKRDPDAAWKVLQLADNKFPKVPDFARRQVFMLIQLGLYQEAAKNGIDYLNRFDASVEDYIAIGVALRQSSQAKTALSILEPARLKFPREEKLLTALALTYADLHHYNTAAELLESVAINNPKYMSDAAELYRRAGQPMRANYLNERTTDPEKKYKLRLSLLLDTGQFAQAENMEEALYRAGLLKDEDIRYALAFAAFRNGHFDASQRHLEKITNPNLFKKATMLRQAMTTCEATPWHCY